MEPVDKIRDLSLARILYATQFHRRLGQVTNADDPDALDDDEPLQAAYVDGDTETRLTQEMRDILHKVLPGSWENGKIEDIINLWEKQVSAAYHGFIKRGHDEEMKEFTLVAFLQDLFELLRAYNNNLLDYPVTKFFNWNEISIMNSRRKAFKDLLKEQKIGAFEWNGLTATWFDFHIAVKTRMRSLGLQALLVEDEAREKATEITLVALTTHDIEFHKSLSDVLMKCKDVLRADFVYETLWGDQIPRGSKLWRLLCGQFETDRMKDSRSSIYSQLSMKERFGTGHIHQDDYSTSKFVSMLTLAPMLERNADRDHDVHVVDKIMNQCDSTALINQRNTIKNLTDFRVQRETLGSLGHDKKLSLWILKGKKKKKESNEQSANGSGTRRVEGKLPISATKSDNAGDNPTGGKTVSFAGQSSKGHGEDNDPGGKLLQNTSKQSSGGKGKRGRKKAPHKAKPAFTKSSAVAKANAKGGKKKVGKGNKDVAKGEQPKTQPKVEAAVPAGKDTSKHGQGKPKRKRRQRNGKSKARRAASSGEHPVGVKDYEEGLFANA